MVWITLPGIYVDKFCHIVANPLCAHHGPHFGNSGFGNSEKLFNLRWPLTVMIIFYIFACKATKLKFRQVPFAFAWV